MLRRHGWALLAYAALTLILTWPLALRAADHHLGGGVDPWLFIWTIGWNVHALTHAPWAIFDANIFYPHRNTLAYTEHLIGPAMMAAPVVWITDNVVLGTNVAAAMSTFLCAVGAYFLARRLGLSRGAAFVCGLVFAFTPPRFGRIYQMHQNAIFAVPFALGFLHAYLTQGRARDLRRAAAMFSVQALLSGHGTALLVLGGAAMIAHHLVTGGAIAWRRRVRDISVPLLLLLPALLFYLPYARARKDVGLVRALDDTGLTASSWLATTSRVDNWLVSWLPKWEWLQQTPDVALFPGVVVILLAVFALRDRRAWLWVSIVVLTIWMTIGPPFSLWQWIYWLPGLSFIRVPSRFMLLGMLALAVLAGIAAERLRLRAAGNTRKAFVPAACALLVAEFASMPVDLRLQHIQPYAIDRYLDTLPKPFTVAEFPIPQSSLKTLVARRHAEYMLHSMAHYQPIIHGFSGIEPPGFEELERTLMLFPDEKSLDTLVFLKVKYAVVHFDYFPPELIDYARTGLERFERAGRLRLVHVEGPGRLYEIH